MALYACLHLENLPLFFCFFKKKLCGRPPYWVRECSAVHGAVPLFIYIGMALFAYIGLYELVHTNLLEIEYIVFGAAAGLTRVNKGNRDDSYKKGEQ